MIGRPLTTIGAAFMAAAWLQAQSAPPPRSPQTFRASTDVVMVDVAVRDGGRAVTGLTAADFVLTDNGERQVIESVETTAVPIDVTLVVDVSGPEMKRKERQSVAARIVPEVKSVTALLRPTDRIRVLAIDRYVQQISPFQPVADLKPAQAFEVGGLSAMFETLAAALLHPVEPARRHVVIARTKGVDTISLFGARALRTIAERSDALFHLVLMESALANEDARWMFQCLPLPSGPPAPVGNPTAGTAPPAGPPAAGGSPATSGPPTAGGTSTPISTGVTNIMGSCWPTSRSWRPSLHHLISGPPTFAISLEGLQVKTGVEATGGRWHQTVGVSEPSLLGTFRETFENFRTNYVLRYTPRGVARGGWHAIEVKTPRFRDYTVSARKGYGIDELPAAPPPPAPVAVPRTLPELTVAYDRGAYQAFASSLRQMGDTARLVKEFESAGNPWPATPRREAAFVLELVEPSLFSARTPDREAAHRLLERFTRLVRDPLEPVMFERYWHFAVLTQLQGTMQPTVAAAFVDRALDRFPTEPQFLLARAIVADQAAYSNRMRGNVAKYAADEALVPQYYEAALAHPETSVEARIRLAWHFHRAGRAADALARLREAGNMATTDPSLRYLRELFLGFVLESQNQPAPAIAAFRAALAIMPTAQSARVALMNVLTLQGDREGSEALAEQIQSEPGRNVVDPWWMYWQGQYRFHQQVMARVRELGR